MNGAEVVASWFTPTVLFCILNLMIGTIFFTHKKQPKAADEQPPQIFRVPSILERVKSINLSRYRSERQPDPVHCTVDPILQHQEGHIDEGEPEHGTEEISHVTRSKSDSAAKKSDLPAARVLKKSASEKVSTAAVEEEVAERRRPATVREKPAALNGEDEAVDEKADDFINRFRQQLKLQRLDSILRYKEMLNRGVGR